MAKGLKALYLHEAKCKRKLERVRRKIKSTDAGGSPSSEDSALEELAPKVKKEPASSSSDEGDGDGDDAVHHTLSCMSAWKHILFKQQMQWTHYYLIMAIVYHSRCRACSTVAIRPQCYFVT